MATADVLAELNRRSAATRGERAGMRKALRAGQLLRSDVIRDEPAWASDQLLYDLLLRQPRFGHGKLRDLNRRAMLAGVNLAQPLELASTRTRDWLVAALRETAR
jgi:hypothetical protein